MGKLTLKFGERILKEVPISERPITIGRSLDSDLQIDNLAVSHHHARVFSEQGVLIVEDLNSANGILLNDAPVKRETVKSGDTIIVGKHAIVVDQEHDVAIFDRTKKVVAPRLQETFVVGAPSKSGNGSNAGDQQTSPSPKSARVPKLLVLKGKTDQKEYLLSVKLLIIGKSPMATLRLRGWFAPAVAAQINKRGDGYYLSATNKRPPKLNGQAVGGATLLKDGDKIEVKGLVLEFADRD
jgi:pSer/pThr/pTyr-binding forkhead associated (FHA) protein